MAESHVPAGRSVLSGVGDRKRELGLPPFQAFLERYGDEVHRFLVASAGRNEADDCFQETFLSALGAYPRLRAGSDLRAWVFTIAHRKAIDAHRTRRRRPEPVPEVPDPPGPPPEEGNPGLWDAVRRLPPQQRAAVALRFAADLPHREVGRVLGCSEATARRAVHDGLNTLRKEWGR